MTEEEKKAIEFLETYIKNDKEDIKILNNTIDEDIDYYTEVEPIQKRVKYLETIKNLIEKLQKENEELKIDLEKANASIVDQTDKDNEIEHLENLLRGNLYDGYLYYKDIAREYQKNYALIEELKNKIAKEKKK